MTGPTEQLGLWSTTLELWANLYRRGAFRPLSPSGSWQAADELVSVARAADDSARSGLAALLSRSNQAFAPLADPLSVDFGVHRWLSSEREEAYSDWFGWLLDQIKDARQVLRILGVKEATLLRACASEEPLIKREFVLPNGGGRLDLLVEFGNRLLSIVEIKTKWFDEDAVREQLTRYAGWTQKCARPTHCCFVAVDSTELEMPLGFELLPWRELSLRLREQALEWIQESKTGPVNCSHLVRSAMTLAFCGAVEQNLLALSKTPKLFRALASGEYLEDWCAKYGG